jgi:hypothetical protein
VSSSPDAFPGCVPRMRPKTLPKMLPKMLPKTKTTNYLFARPLVHCVATASRRTPIRARQAYSFSFQRTSLALMRKDKLFAPKDRRRPMTGTPTNAARAARCRPPLTAARWPTCPWSAASSQRPHSRFGRGLAMYMDFCARVNTFFLVIFIFPSAPSNRHQDSGLATSMPAPAGWRTPCFCRHLRCFAARPTNKAGQPGLSRA